MTKLFAGMVLTTGFMVMLLTSHQQDMPPSNQTHVLRLLPGDDLRVEITRFVREHDIRAGWIVTCVGSLTRLHLRYANQPEGTVREGHVEIVSLTGTVSVNGSHLHLSASDSTGLTVGGHLLDGNIVYTTAEIVIGEDPNLTFTREMDGTTPWPELQVRSRDQEKNPRARR